MFPFLSVLCTVIGVLMLFLLLTMSARITEESQRPLPDNSSAGGGPSEAPFTEDELKRLRSELAALSAQLSAEHAKLDKLQQQKEELRELLAFKQESRGRTSGDGLFVGVELSSEVSVLMKPADNIRTMKRPRFIEVGLSDCFVYPEQTRFSVNELPGEERPLTVNDPSTTPLERFFAAADRRRDREYLVFLVRAGGCEAFSRVRNYLIRRYPHPRTRALSRIDMGWEPFAPEWLLAIENRDSP